jgi:hypothetical protein
MQEGLPVKIVYVVAATALSTGLVFSFGTSTPVRSQVQQVKTQSQTQCVCYLSVNSLTNNTSPAGSLYSVSSPATISANSPSQCQSACAARATSNLQAEASNLCIGGPYNVPNGTTVRGYYKYTGTFQFAAVLGVLTNTPLVSSAQWQCPPTWYSNTALQLGGITGDQKCKKMAGSISGVSAPANGTQLGSWGFTWGNELWAWGSAANGGAAFHPFTPAQCHF